MGTDVGRVAAGWVMMIRAGGSDRHGCTTGDGRMDSCKYLNGPGDGRCRPTRTVCYLFIFIFVFIIVIVS